ncbi:cupin domain-containing protein [Candidatus Woesearchaeota archaeon]|nr:cupin domain-containing protein [Candidatus Woesearchaeota archaeon]
MDFSSILDRFKEKKILVAGDIMLDKHIYGSVSRISPEAPVPVLKAEKEIFNPGGAANLASNLSSLGAKVYLAGIVGNDDAQKILFNELHKMNIDSSCIVKSNKPTIQKIRGLSKQHLFRIDYEDNSKINLEDESTLLSLVRSKIHDVDAVILSDYAKGTLTENLVKEIISLARQNGRLITADCKPINFYFYKNVDLLKPNKKEAIEMTLKENVEDAGRKLMDMMGAHILVTRGNEGMTLFEKDAVTTFPAKAKNIFDVSGAGDTVLATLTLAWISGASLKEAAELSNNAAAIVIEKPGVVVITSDELKSSLVSSVKIVPKVWGEEQWLVNNEKYCGKRMSIKEGYYCSYHKHRIKEETFYVLDGTLEVIKEGQYLVVKTGETLHLKPGEYHSFRALKDTTFFEFSTQHFDEDNYRLTQSSYGSHEKWKNEIEEVIK